MFAVADIYRAVFAYGGRITEAPSFPRELPPEFASGTIERTECGFLSARGQQGVVRPQSGIRIYTPCKRSFPLLLEGENRNLPCSSRGYTLQ